ncbi:MAG: ABC transporter ATP-binding protein [Bacteroidales bacterium]|nr:ABC transporter ATP-binding protein [Bacteroidales bacterium]HOK99773.1 ABC transporter ATP-binding protein [Bacteroidales bacterium]HPO66543.1 ABC transporter ATP-binding protein [Bacteroidales bacterium]
MEQVNKAISVKNLSFAYKGDYVLNGVNADIEMSKLTFILGKNGSGKSTFLRILAGLLPYQSGNVYILGNDNSKLSFAKRAKLIGFLGQQHKAVFPFTVEEVVLTGRAGYVNLIPKESDKQAAYNAIEKVGITHLQNRIYTELSGGEQQLVMIARVLAQNPKILLLDEPTSHLDFINQSHLLVLLKKLANEGLTIVAVLHDPNLAFLYGDDFLFVKDKQVIRSASNVDAWNVDFLRTIYHDKIETIPYNGRALLVPFLN